MIKEAISKLVKGEDLSGREMETAMTEIFEGKATPAQIGALITALRIKGETVVEITAAARALRARAARVSPVQDVLNVDRDEINAEEETLLDTCGTGGDGTNTFNISTATALVAAGGGVRVAKHGNRAVSSRCGSADVLYRLGVSLELEPADVERCIREVGIGFLYAPVFHGAMRYAAEARREVGLRSVFNLLGPLTNPAGATAQVMGVYEPGLTEVMAGVLGRLGCREAFVVCGEETLDEISICGPTRISHLKDGKVRTFRVEPEDFGFDRADPRTIRGGTAEENAAIIRRILKGEAGPSRDVVVINAAAAFVAAGVEADFKEGTHRAVQAIDSGKALEKLERLISFTCERRSHHGPAKGQVKAVAV